MFSRKRRMDFLMAKEDSLITLYPRTGSKLGKNSSKDRTFSQEQSIILFWNTWSKINEINRDIGQIQMRLLAWRMGWTITPFPRLSGNSYSINMTATRSLGLNITRITSFWLSGQSDQIRKHINQPHRRPQPSWTLNKWIRASWWTMTSKTRRSQFWT